MSDRSVPNLSSIVLLVEDEGRSLLLAADARGDRIARALGRGTPASERPAHVEVLKVPHHGSGRSVDEPFFRAVHADVYLFCGNGRHGNPERRTVERLLAARAGERIALVFTSAASSMDGMISAERERERARCRSKGREEPSAWMAETDGLEHLLDRTPAEVTVTYMDVDPLAV